MNVNNKPFIPQNRSDKYPQADPQNAVSYMNLDRLVASNDDQQRKKKKMRAPKNGTMPNFN